MGSRGVVDDVVGIIWDLAGRISGTPNRPAELIDARLRQPCYPDLDQEPKTPSYHPQLFTILSALFALQGQHADFSITAAAPRWRVCVAQQIRRGEIGE